MITDLHLHFCDSSKYTELEDYCRRTGIKRAALVSIPNLESGTFNNAVLSAVKKAPDRFIGFGALDYRERNFSGQVAALKSAGFTGLKIWLGKPQAERIFGLKTSDPPLLEAFSAAEELSIPVLYHAADPPDFWDPGGIYAGEDYDPFERYIDDAVICAESFPDITFIMAHMLFLAGGMTKLAAILLDHPNIYLDLAPGRWFYYPLSINIPETRKFFFDFKERIFLGSDAIFFPESFGIFGRISPAANATAVERIMSFLSSNEPVDNPYPGTADMHPAVAGLGLDKKTIEMIFSRNADRFFPRRKVKR